MEQKKELVYFPTWTAGRKGYSERVRQVFQDYLKKKDLVFTTQRSMILDHLLSADRHLSQDEIYGALKSKGIGKITVFRTLKMLEECHLIERVTDSHGKPRYEIEIDRPHHDHLICLGCGMIIEIQWPQVERIQEKVSKKIGFTISYHRHELFGFCKECGNRQN
ncbi:MAG: transcriptional repressor [Elusimicrobia bacterium]|nr:transcriptional repressor [Elusimicrobiota bacterium]